MSGAFALAGFYFGRKPTSATSQAEVSVANSSMPWQVEGDHHDHDNHSTHFKYQYHPQGDTSKAPRNAPSALNTVVVPNVTLPKVRSTSQIARAPKTDSHGRSYMTNSTNGARKAIEHLSVTSTLLVCPQPNRKRLICVEELSLGNRSKVLYIQPNFMIQNYP